MNDRSNLTKRIHIALLVMGAVIFASVSLSGNIWFDECYSVAAVSHSVFEMPKILLDDVHPFLYYVLLKAVSLLTGGNFTAMRLFSALGMWTLALAGYTHVRAHLSEKAGLLFTLFTIISPASIKYACEIRMYSWGAVFVFFSAFYAYLSVKNNFSSRRHGILFVIFSVAAAYMHYYGLVTVCVINAFVIVGTVIRKVSVKSLILHAASELALYIPGAVIFLIQVSRVAAGEYWIRVKYPDVLLQTMSYSLTGGDSYWDTYMSSAIFNTIVGIATLLFLLTAAGIVYSVIKHRNDDKSALPAALALGVFVGVVACGLVVSIFKEFYYVRYSMLMHGLLLFALAYAASRIKYKSALAAVIAGVTVASAAVMIPFYGAMYNGDAANAKAALSEAFKEGDVLVYNQLTPGSVVTRMLPEAEQYFYSPKMEAYPRAYTAFEPSLTTVADADDLPRDIDGRLWVMVDEWGSEKFMATLYDTYPSLEITDEFRVSIKYRNNNFRFFICNING